MTEEVKEEKVVIEESVKEVVDETPEYSAAEQAAMEQGWLPKEDWEEAGRDPDEWRSAREFNDRGEFFKTIHQQKREMKARAAAIDSLKKHHQFVFDQAYRKAKAELKKERREAFQNEDLDKVETIEEQMEQLDNEHVQKKQELVQPVPTSPAEFELWRDRNAWYDRDEELRDYADFAGLTYARKNPGVPSVEVLEHVNKEVKKKFPEKFGLKKSAPNAVSAVDRTRSGRKSEPAYELNELETKIMKDLVSQGVMTKEQYIKELKQYKEGK